MGEGKANRLDIGTQVEEKIMISMNQLNSGFNSNFKAVWWHLESEIGPCQRQKPNEEGYYFYLGNYHRENTPGE